MDSAGAFDLSLIRELAAATAQAAIDRAPIPKLRSGTVTTAGTTQPLVQVDGDAAPVALLNLTGRFLTVGSRVMVLFQPPQGAYVVGIIAYAVVPWATQPLGTTNWTNTVTTFNRGLVDGKHYTGDTLIDVTGVPAGGNLLVDLPYLARYGDWPVGIFYQAGLVFDIHGILRTGGGRTQAFAIDDVGTFLASGAAGAGDSLRIHWDFEIG